MCVYCGRKCIKSSELQKVKKPYNQNTERYILDSYRSHFRIFLPVISYNTKHFLLRKS